MINLREIILGALMDIVEEEQYSHIVLKDVLEKYQYLDKRDRAFITRVTEGTLENMLQMDYIIERFSKVKVENMKPVIRNILRMSVYQLKYMDSVPASAACNEAVKLAQKKGFRQLKGFVNGVLRNIARNLSTVKLPPEKEPVRYLSVRYSMPEWMVKEWLTSYGREQTETMLAAFYEKEPLTIRVNRNRISPADLKVRLEARGIHMRPAPYIDGALQMDGFDYLGGLDEFREGLFQVQDVSSMLAVEIAGVKAGDHCIDVCAAPGGKSLYLAEKAGETGGVDARDLTDYKAEMIRDNAERLGVTNVTVSVKDACVYDEASKEKADVLLADLPCSGLGVLSKKTDIKYRMSKEQQQELQELERKILSTAEAYVKPGGTLVYSTCTINRGENEENVRWFLSHFPYEAVSLDDCLPEELRSETTKQGYLQLLPGVHRCDGFFIAKFRRKIGK